MNVAVLLIPVFGLLWADQYQQSLIEAELSSLESEGRIIGSAIAGIATFTNDQGRELLVQSRANLLVARLTAETHTRVMVFRPSGDLISDSARFEPSRQVQIGQPLATEQNLWQRFLAAVSAASRPNRLGRPLFEELTNPKADNYREVRSAFFGEIGRAVRVNEEGELVVSVGLPITNYRRILGALLVMRDKTEIDENLARIRLSVITIFLVALTISVGLSFYLSRSIAQPIISLARAADLIRFGRPHRVSIPNLSRRKDEIGDLSQAMRRMIDALWTRMTAIESFAADVSHELKNPLTSINSAMETMTSIKDEAKKKKLLAIVLHDLKRLDRLITDISNASRLDAELARAEPEKVNIAQLLEALVETHSLTRNENQPSLVMEPVDRDLIVNGFEGRLGQVFRNLIDNAMSFSPARSEIRLRVTRVSSSEVEISVEDEGPGLPADKLDAVFERFYTDRPGDDGSFGQHSGLGLSISRQIIEAHNGLIFAENWEKTDGEPGGARITVRLPLA